MKREAYNPETCKISLLVEEFFDAIDNKWLEKADRLYIVLIRRLTGYLPR